MKKLIAALVVCVGTTAFAGDAAQKVQAEQKAQNEKTRDATQVFTQQPGSSIEDAKRDSHQGINATEVGPKISKTAKDITGHHSDKSTLKAMGAFDLQGIISKRSDDEVTIARQGLPSAELDVRNETAVWLDGKQVKADSLPEGAQVRAKFQLDGDNAVAVELRATSAKGTLK
ncbi:hypothetical protein [Stigmatella aurantiaca]|uniref:Conserved uncharacterized protein n=1 Tax=Stigmatella aurantiaca (strain DW4/3-1) TaxID=378806 RepID=Q091P5_STIAD|nr:hypothetical protein [Stigmatella aurantiaca]ADO68655.1 conserved uncharacterized protein [Stigmatella aurantiaca DW4/3-1]EAU66446.1 hypothetical protein STIAU_0557 [Stigmatella aurantiaca DW4/3-1]